MYCFMPNYKKFLTIKFITNSFTCGQFLLTIFIYVSEFNAIYGFFILSSVYDCAFEFWSTMGTRTVSN